MIILKLVISALSRNPSFRVMVFVCFNALNKTFESLFIHVLPMDTVTRVFFEVVHVVLLVSLVVEVFDMLCRSVFGVSLFKRRTEAENEIADTDDVESLLRRAKLRAIGDKMKSLLPGPRR